MMKKIIRFVSTFIRTFKNVSLVIEYEERLSSLKAMKNTQCTNGTWDYDHYLHGMANGMIFSVAILENKNPVFLEAPKEFIRIKENGEKANLERGFVKYPDQKKIIPFPKSDCYCDD